MNCADTSLIMIALCISAASITVGLIIGWCAWAPIHSQLDDLEYVDTYQGRYPQGVHQVARDHVAPKKPWDRPTEKRPGLTSDNIIIDP